MMISPADAVETYILAKDGNRPFLMQGPSTRMPSLKWW